MRKNVFLFILFSSTILFAQKFEVRGTLTDSLTNQVLSFANVRVQNSTLGTSATISGEYLLKLEKGNYTLIASYIGYESDTSEIKLDRNLKVNFALMPAPVEYQEITVVPGVNPAIAIIEKAIDRKHERNSKLRSYVFDAYTKGKIRSTEEISADRNSVGVGFGGADSSELKITGIIENQSKGYFLKPDYYKEEIVARKQTANFPSSINLLTGGRIIQNFYSDDIQFFGRPLTSPLADNALNYYYYYLEDTLAIDAKKVFQIYFSTIDDSSPGFYGRIFISDKTYDLLQVDIDLNSAANPGGIFSQINIFQQFVPYDDNIYMPIDYRLFIEGNYLGLLKFGFEISSILYDYKINPGLTPDDFGMLALKVLENADNKDSTYWKNTQTIPLSEEEVLTYSRIDSLESIERTFWDRFSPLASEIYLDDNFYVSGPISLYHFNKVEGHSIDLRLGVENYFNERLSAEAKVSYGFGDEYLKKELNLRYLAGNYRTTELSLKVFDKTESLFNESDNYNKLTSTLTSLFGKYDFRDYFNTKGYEFKISGEVIPILEVSFGFGNRQDKSLTNNSDYSFFNRDKTYKENRNIFDTEMTLFSLGFQFDFRKYIEDGMYRRRINDNSTFSFGGEYVINSESFFNFEIYKFNLHTRLNSFASTSIDLWAESTLGNGAMPLQMMKALPGNIQASGKSRTFRTLRFGEVFGDRVVTANLEYNFNDEIWRFLNIPLLKDSQISLIGYINAAYVDITEDSDFYFDFMRDYKQFLNPFYESGFSIGHPLIPLRLEFTWKLNHRGNNNFVIGINTFIL